MLSGLAAVAVPIIIHLISRRRFRRVKWAAMRFLEQAEHENRRRIRHEHLLLLLLRCLAIALLVLLLARPRTEQNQVKSISSTPTEHIFLIDDSPSMTLQNGQETLFKHSIRAIHSFLKDNLDAGAGNDVVTLLTTSDPNVPLENGKKIKRINELSHRLDALETRDQSANLESALVSLKDFLGNDQQRGEANSNRYVYFITDLRQADWLGGEGHDARGKNLSQILGEIRELVNGVKIVNAAEGVQFGNNYSVTSVVPRETLISSGVPVTFDVKVSNHSGIEGKEAKVFFAVSGGVSQYADIKPLAPGESVTVPFSFTFSEPGQFSAIAQLEADDLIVGNQRHCVVEVKQGRRILLVDGDPARSFGSGETFFLARALAPPGDSGSGNMVETMTETQLNGVDLTPYDVVYLCNVSSVSPEVRDAMESFVRNGGSLVLCLGNRVLASSWNTELYRDGKGLLPARLGEVQGDEKQQRWVSLAEVQENHPMMGIFVGNESLFLKRIKFYQWWTMGITEDEKEAVSVVARFNDPSDTPAIVEKSFGDGRVMLLGSSIDSAWNTWSSEPSYLVAMLEMAAYLTKIVPDTRNVVVGAPLTQELDMNRFHPQADLYTPESQLPNKVSALENKNEDVEPFFQLDRTTRAGVYRFELNDLEGAKQNALFAANLAAGEGNLVSVGVNYISDSLKPAGVDLASLTTFLTTQKEGEIRNEWALLLGGLLILILLIEQMVARAFGGRR